MQDRDTNRLLLLRLNIIKHSKLNADSNYSNDKTRNSSDEIANVNFLYDDIVHSLQKTIETRA